jgi:hypothetical protein
LSPAVARELGHACNFSSYFVEYKERALFCGIIATDIGLGNVRFYMDIDHTFMYVHGILCEKFIRIVMNT